MTLWEDRVGKAGRGAWRGAGRGEGAGEGGRRSLRHRFSVDLEGIMKRFLIIFGYFWL